MTVVPVGSPLFCRSEQRNQPRRIETHSLRRKAKLTFSGRR
ncbi:unnamed protein product [Nippostrongylus brasiliensis]|uniref:DUF1534 domain-containing protein n=1 Tax=Nippostrongylus brasiliensis TaxID=27835 RepID=A0A0N4XRZ4_NIPBR|nr:unnamed protein product [Nippostrongylus brasiliensis]